ncbi:MAG TPA: hypothetical protein VFG42_12605 [Baekduia sp.]|uniref:hypothetical protein n=1 Tax=Baekduia sp. TaxID=2600305 RepID=UPI002D771A80|nr:hypothetical protein [Baekduia sp.]HET6507622.1 hypothetical protein [Baekduia sp.]
MPKHLVAAVGVVAACALGTGSAEAATLDAKVAVTPNTGGSARHPQGHRVTVDASVVVPEGEFPPTLTGVELWYGPGLEFHRDGVPTCSPRVLSQGGPTACPPRSQVGQTGGGGIEPDDPVEAQPKFHLFNAPGGRMTIYATLQHPARVRAVMPGTVIDGARGAWPHRDAWTFPVTLQNVAQMPVTIGRLRFSFGGTRAAPHYVASTSCPPGGWPWRMRVHAGATVLVADGRAPCRR